MLSIRGPGLAGLRDTNLTDGVVQGDAPAYHIDSVTDYTAITLAPAPRTSGWSRAPSRCPASLNQAGCPSGSTFDLDSDQMPIRSKEHDAGAVFLQHPALGGRRRCRRWR